MKHSTGRAGMSMLRASFGRLTLAISVSGALAACAMAPGMRMPSATDAAQTNENAAGTPPFVVTELDIGVARRLAAGDRADDGAPARSLFGAPQRYRVGPGDVLQIVVWDHPEFAEALGAAQGQPSSRESDPAAGFVVDQSGAIQFPYAGVLRVAGLSPEEIRQRLRVALEKYLVTPQVTVRVASYRSHQVYVDGEVRAPGALALTDVPLNLYDAVARAGGFGENADQSDIALVRNGVTYRIDLPRMLASGRNPSTLFLAAGDMLRVGSRADNEVYVMGEVNRPGSAVPRRDGRLSLADALSQAGSINSNTADTAQMFVIRANGDTPRVFHLDSRSPVSMLVARDFELEPKDIVYVDGNALVRFNRVMTLLAPVINAGLTAGVIAK